MGTIPGPLPTITMECCTAPRTGALDGRPKPKSRLKSTSANCGRTSRLQSRHGFETGRKHLAWTTVWNAYSEVWHPREGCCTKPYVSSIKLVITSMGQQGVGLSTKVAKRSWRKSKAYVRTFKNILSDGRCDVACTGPSNQLIVHSIPMRKRTLVVVMSLLESLKVGRR